MRIEVLYFDGCPNYLPVVDRLRTVLAAEEFARTGNRDRSER